MARRLVLKAIKEEMSLDDLVAFVNAAKRYGITTSASIDVSLIGETALFGLTIPNNILPDGRKVKVKKETAHQKAVREQIEKHKEDKKAGKKVAYVPPVGSKNGKPPKPPKVKCPVCNVRKGLTGKTVKTIRPHVSHGEPCSGGGTQVVKRGKTWKVADNG